MAPRARRSQTIVEIGLIFMLFFIHGAWPAPEVNETHYLAKAKHFWQPDWCHGDFFLNTRDAHQTFYWTFGWLANWLSLPAMAWCGRLVTWGLLAVAWQRLSAAVSPGRFWSVLAAALWVAMTYRAHMAGEWVIGGVEAKGFAFVAVLFGLKRLAIGRWNSAWLLLGVASAFHVVIGAWAVIAAAAVWLTLRKRPTFGSMAPALACGFALSLPGLAPGLLLGYGADAATVNDANRIYVFERLPHHLVLYRLPTWFIERHLLLMIAWGVMAWLANRALRRADRAMVGGSSHSNDQSMAANIGIHSAAYSPITIINRFTLACIAIAVAGAIVTVATLSEPTLAAKLLRYYWYRMTDFVTPLGFGLSTVSWLSISIRNTRVDQASWRENRRYRRVGGLFCVHAATLIAIIVAGSHFGELIYNRRQLKSTQHYCAQADLRVPDLLDWIAACRWIASEPSIPREAIFLTPRATQSFRWYAERAEVVSNKDIPQDAAGIVAWWERLQDVHRGGTHREPSPWHASLNELSTARLLALGDRYGADYLITASQPPLDLPRIGPSELAYAIYRLPRRAGSGANASGAAVDACANSACLAVPPVNSDSLP